jgi:DNA mismatch repair protein MutS2
VLADIGDAQSLQQNLSTFSGHIRRVNAILGAAGKRSLVLLDEVGSGTDPIEGAALARAVLDRLAGQAGLTLATTHHAELKTVAADDPRYVNVSMEFDVATLSPTYRLMWGSAGASNALDIAQALGFDGAVLKDARSVARALSATDADRASKMDAVAASLEQQLAEAQADLEVLARRRVAADERSDDLGEELRELAGVRDKVDERGGGRRTHGTARHERSTRTHALDAHAHTHTPHTLHARA